MIRTKSEDAVSPVIGVMLMLVVTIVIAAVVAAFAGGLGADAETAPTTVLDVHDLSTGHMETIEKITLINVRNQPKYFGDESGNEVDESVAAYRYVYPSGGNMEDAYARISTADSNIIELLENANEHTDKWTIESSDEKNYDKTVTISSLHGDVLDVSKLSVRIYSGDTLISENPVNTPSGVLSPGDSISVTLSDPTNNMISKSESYKLEVLYGSHSIVSKKLTATQEW